METLCHGNTLPWKYFGRSDRKDAAEKGSMSREPKKNVRKGDKLSLKGKRLHSGGKRDSGKRQAYLQALEENHEELEMQHRSLLHTQTEMETSRDHYVELFDSVPACFVTLTRTGVIRELNLPGVRLLNSRQHRLKGWPFVGFIANGDKKNFISHLVKCRANSDPTRPISTELQLARKPGEAPVFIELASLPAAESGSRQAVFKSVFSDITVIKELREAQRWLAGIVESSDDAIIGQNLEGNIISSNGGAERLFGHSSLELLGQSMTLLIPQERREEEMKILKSLRLGEKVERHETVRQCKDGTLISVSLTISAIRNARGKIIGFANITHDISERKETEKKLGQSLKRERAANHAKNDFLAALSHELRTPLNPVLLLASDGARNAEFPPQARMDFDAIRKNVELEVRLIDDLLDLTRVKHGKLTLENKPVDIHIALQDAAGTVHSDIKQKKIELIFNLRASKPMIFGDAVRMRQVFWNVLKNAVKFTPHGGKITVETWMPKNDEIVIAITDTGMGMEPEDMKRIFGAFEQGTHQFGGLGLGLAISSAVVEMHSGAIRAESPGKGKGATFFIELPLAGEAKLQARDMARIASASVAVPGQTNEWQRRSHPAGGRP